MTRYTVEEFLEDIGHCKASLIFVLNDQNFGGVLLRAIKNRPDSFSNVVVISATRQSSIDKLADETTLTNLYEQFYHPHGLQPGQYDVYGVDGLLTNAIEYAPLSKIAIGDIEKVITNLHVCLYIYSKNFNCYSIHFISASKDSFLNWNLVPSTVARSRFTHLHSSVKS